MATITMKIPNAELKRALRNINKYNQETQQDVKTEIRATAFDVETSAKKKVPVISSRLKTDINNISTDNGFGAEVRNTVEYAPKVELGLGRIAKPYLRPAFEEQSPKLLKRIIKILKKV